MPEHEVKDEFHMGKMPGHAGENEFHVGKMPEHEGENEFHVGKMPEHEVVEESNEGQMPKHEVVEELNKGQIENNDGIDESCKGQMPFKGVEEEELRVGVPRTRFRFHQCGLGQLHGTVTVLPMGFRSKKRLPGPLTLRPISGKSGSR